MTGAVSELLSILNNEATGATSGCTIGPKCHEMVIQHTDLMLKWVALALCLRGKFKWSVEITTFGCNNI